VVIGNIKSGRTKKKAIDIHVIADEIFCAIISLRFMLFRV